MKRIALVVLVLALAAWAAFGVSARRARDGRRRTAAAEVARGPAELRGAYHVHTTASDGRGTLDEVVDAARAAHLDFVVVTDHNVRVPARPAWIRGVLVVPGTEASTPWGHVVALGVPRALTVEERQRDPLGAIRALGGQAVLAHPLHPRRPFTGWGGGTWRGLEVVSNDTSWHRVVVDRDVGRVVRAALDFPWDGGLAVLALSSDPAGELARFDAEERRARGAGARTPAHVLLCSADAHGLPSYRAAFEAFTMRVPVARTGDAEADARAVTAALLDGSASCVVDAIAPAAHVRLDAAPGALSLSLDGATPAGTRFQVLRDGVPFGELAPGPDGRRTLRCEGRCPPGDYRVEARVGGCPWIFTNPVAIE